MIARAYFLGILMLSLFERPLEVQRRPNDKPERFGKLEKRKRAVDETLQVIRNSYGIGDAVSNYPFPPGGHSSEFGRMKKRFIEVSRSRMVKKRCPSIELREHSAIFSLHYKGRGRKQLPRNFRSIRKQDAAQAGNGGFRRIGTPVFSVEREPLVPRALDYLITADGRAVLEYQE
jgi:hypothetical protein